MELENAGAEAPVAEVALPVVETPASVEPEVVDLDKELSSIWQKNNRDREPNGQFKGKDGIAPPATDLKDQPQIAATEPAQPAIQAPQSWSADVKAKWATLPPDLQAYIAKREGESHQAISKYGEQVKQYEPLGKVIDHYRGSFERSGVTPDEGISRLLEADQRLNQDPHSAIAWLANAYGVNLAELVGPMDGNAPEGALHQTIQELRSELNQIRSGLNEQQQHKATTELRSLESQIGEFSKDKADWAELEQEILAEVVALKHTSPNSQPLETLQKAYDRARWANPEARERTLKQQREAEDKKNLEEARQRAEKARNASSVNVRSSTAGGTATGSLDDTLKSAFRTAQSR